MSGIDRHASESARAAGERACAQLPDVPTAPSVAREVFGDELPTAEQYAALLATTGVSHGLIGPREVPRLWDRHILNCAVVQEHIPVGATVVDVGSGAGLPGLALAIARPDLRLILVEPMLRRTNWLDAAVAELGLSDRVEVRRSRAEAQWSTLSAPVVTARAVARLADLAVWCLPLVAPGGCLLALKGAGAQEEIDECAAELASYGVTSARVVLAGERLLSDPEGMAATTLVRLVVGEAGVSVPQARVGSLAKGRPRKVVKDRRRGRRS